MSKIVNNAAHTNKPWYHIKLTLICIFVPILSFCIVANYDDKVYAVKYMREIKAVNYYTGNESVARAPVITGSWKKVTGAWRFYNTDGVMQKGVFTIKGNKYYLGKNDGIMKTGWQKIDRYYYYFGTDGALKTGWQQIDGRWYYLGGTGDGVMRADWQKIDGSYYYLGDANDGGMKTGWQQIDGRWYYLGGTGDGVMRAGWQKIDGSYYYLGDASDGGMKVGWQQIYDRWYYLGGTGDGAMRTSWQKIDGSYYYLGDADDGGMKTGWQQIDEYWYYLGGVNDGAMKVKWQHLGNSWYYLGDVNDGTMKTGWKNIESAWYYFNESGVAKKDWQHIAGNWFYFDSSYMMVKDTIMEIAGHKYAFNADGVMLSNEFTFKGKRYITDSSGRIVYNSSQKDVVKYGRRFIGENGNRFNDWYYGDKNHRSLAWCNVFVSYVMYQCGVNFQKNAYVPNSEEWMHKNYKWVDYKEAKAGDVIVFCWTGQGYNSGRGNRDHIGFLISKNANGTFTTLEGNTNGGKVAIRTRYSKNIRNIFSPR